MVRDIVMPAVRLRLEVLPEQGSLRRRRLKRQAGEAKGQHRGVLTIRPERLAEFDQLIERLLKRTSSRSKLLYRERVSPWGAHKAIVLQLGIEPLALHFVGVAVLQDADHRPGPAAARRTTEVASLHHDRFTNRGRCRRKPRIDKTALRFCAVAQSAAGNKRWADACRRLRRSALRSRAEPALA